MPEFWLIISTRGVGGWEWSFPANVDFHINLINKDLLPEDSQSIINEPITSNKINHIGSHSS